MKASINVNFFSHFLHTTVFAGECRKYEYIFNQKVIFTFGAGRLINDRLSHVDFVDKLNLLIATAKYIFKLSFFLVLHKINLVLIAEKGCSLSAI